MNTSDNTNRPFGYWITAVNRLMRAEFATVFADEGITRRDWRLLNRIEQTPTDNRPMRGFGLRRLVEFGWVARTREGWMLTDAGALAKQRLGASVDEIRARVSNALDPAEYEAMTASLQKVASAFGWEEGKRLPRTRRRKHHAHGFGRDQHGCRHGRRHQGIRHEHGHSTHVHIHTHS